MMRRVVVIVLGSVLCFVQGLSFAAADTRPDGSCGKYAGTRAKLDQIYEEYVSLPKTAESAEKLFLLYQRLEKVGQEVHALYPDYQQHYEEYPVISRCLEDSRFEELGIYVGHYSERLEYSEKLMAEAHRLNPNTKYRRYTLYSEVLGNNIGVELVDLPNIEQAKLYLKEFPDGPYAAKVHLILAGFYHDLFMSLQFGENLMGGSNSCYVDYVANHPDEANPDHARQLAILHFEKAIAATPPENGERRDYERELDALRRRVPDNVINWCTD